MTGAAVILAAALAVCQPVNQPGEIVFSPPFAAGVAAGLGLPVEGADHVLYNEKGATAYVLDAGNCLIGSGALPRLAYYAAKAYTGFDIVRSILYPNYKSVYIDPPGQ